MNYLQRVLETKIQPYIHTKEAIVVTGFRRVGKTTLMRKLFNDIQSSNKLYLDLESPVNQRIFENENYENIILELSTLGINPLKKAYLFIDEIQKIKNLPSIIKYLYDHYQLKFFLTGSSSFYLKNYFSESLAGRKIIFEMFPLTFAEFLRFKNTKLTISSGYENLIGFYKEYMEYGGFPSVVEKETIEEKKLALDDVLGSYFELDVKNLADFNNNENLKKLLFLLVNRIGQKVEVSKLATSLQVSRPTIYNYLSFFEQTYLIHLIKPISGSSDVQIRTLPKLYFNDSGIINRIGRVSLGSLFENTIFNQLYTKAKYSFPTKFSQTLVSYYQLKTGAEIDFIYQEKIAYEVKTTAHFQDLNALKKNADKIKIRDYKIVSMEKTQLTNHFLYPFTI